jgi:hypothetical protein
MSRNIVIVNATQIITSEANPYGLFSVVSGFPKVFDSGEGGDIEQTMKNAKSAYFAQLSANYANTNPNRVMTTVTLEVANGQQIMHECIGVFPTPQPEPEPTPEPEEAEEE